MHIRRVPEFSDFLIQLQNGRNELLINSSGQLHSRLPLWFHMRFRASMMLACLILKPLYSIICNNVPIIAQCHFLYILLSLQICTR